MRNLLKFSGVYTTMKYWGFFLSKLIAVAIIFVGLWIGLNKLLPASEFLIKNELSRFPHDLPWTTAMMAYTLLAIGAMAIVVIDQRYRCRSCLRKLRMPVETGAWAQVLRIGVPHMEWICPYGHGTLKVSEIHFAGRLSDDWQKNDDNIWRELESAHMRD